MASIPQYRNWIEDWGGKNSEISRQVWETVENKARMAEIKGEETEEREGAKRKEERVYKTDSWRRNGDSENDRRKAERRRFDRD